MTVNFQGEYQRAKSFFMIPMWSVENFYRAKLFSLIKDVKNLRVLDFGCGPGIFSRYLCERNDVYAFDIDDWSENFKDTGVKFFRHDGNEPLPFEDNFFDLILANEVLEHIPNLNHSLGEISRTLKRRGTFIADVPNSSWNFLTEMIGGVGNLYYSASSPERIRELGFSLLKGASKGKYKFSKLFYLIKIYAWQLNYCKKEHVHKHSYNWWAKKFENHEFKVKKIIPSYFIPFTSFFPESLKPKIYSRERSKERSSFGKCLSTNTIFSLQNQS